MSETDKSGEKSVSDTDEEFDLFAKERAIKSQTKRPPIEDAFTNVPKAAAHVEPKPVPAIPLPAQKVVSPQNGSITLPEKVPVLKTAKTS